MKYKVLIFSLLFAMSIYAQNNPDKNTTPLKIDSDFFINEKPFRIILKADFKKLGKEKQKKEYQKAELIYFAEDSTEVHNQILIKTRGNNRNSVCFFPPLQIVFWDKTENGDTLPLRKYKMVVHCNDTKASEIAILKEYLCYRLYSCITDKSFKVRLLNVNYVYKKAKDSEASSFAILIENEENMNNRLNTISIKNENLSQVSVNQENIMMLAMFEFMIGNFDWGIPTQRNLKLVKPNQNQAEIYAVPYDFDYCGLVNANYAFPAENMGIKSVTERLYLGQCKPMGDFLPVIERFKELKPGFYQQIENFEYLDKNQKKLMINYLDEFYEILESKGLYSNYIRKNCKELK